MFHGDKLGTGGLHHRSMISCHSVLFGIYVANNLHTANDNLAGTVP